MMLPPTAFAIHVVEVADGSVRIGVEGEIDLVSAPSFSKVLLSHVAERRNVVLDLSKTTFMDSSGLKAVIDGLRESRRCGGHLILEPEPPRQIRRLFEISGVGAVLRAESSDLMIGPR